MKEPKNLEEFTVEATKEFKSGIKVRAMNPYDAMKKAGIKVKKGSGKVGRPRLYEYY